VTDCELHFQYTRAIARAAFFDTFWGIYLMRVIASAIAFGLCLSLLTIPDVRPIACFALGLITMVWWSWLKGYQWSRNFASQLRNPNIIVKLDDSAITFQSADALSQLSWASIAMVRRCRRVWIIYQRDSWFARPVPVQALTPEAKDLLVRMVGNAGGKVR